MKYPDDYVGKVFHADCLDFLLDIPDNSIDLVIIDPPYSLDYEFPNDKLSYKEQGNFMIQYGKLIYSRLKDGGTVCVFMSQEMSHYLYFSFTQKGNHFVWQNEIVWNRDGGQMPTSKFGVCHENILIFTKGNSYKTFNLDELRVKSKYAETDKRLNPKGKNPGDVWYVPALFGKKLERLVDDVTGKALHPTQKPLDVILPLVIAYSNEGDYVLDCFSGSGTTAVACKKLNRNFVGCDKELKYVNAANLLLEETKNELV
jgi:DNA modification methylase